MNLIEHYIEEVHAIEDVSEIFEKKNGYPPKEQLLNVDLTYNCYGQIQRETRMFHKSEWDEAVSKKFFMA